MIRMLVFEVESEDECLRESRDEVGGIMESSDSVGS